MTDDNVVSLFNLKEVPDGAIFLQCKTCLGAERKDIISIYTCADEQGRETITILCERCKPEQVLATLIWAQQDCNYCRKFVKEPVEPL